MKQLVLSVAVAAALVVPVGATRAQPALQRQIDSLQVTCQGLRDQLAAQRKALEEARFALTKALAETNQFIATVQRDAQKESNRRKCWKTTSTLKVERRADPHLRDFPDLGLTVDTAGKQIVVLCLLTAVRGTAVGRSGPGQGDFVLLVDDQAVARQSSLFAAGRGEESGAHDVSLHWQGQLPPGRHTVRVQWSYSGSGNDAKLIAGLGKGDFHSLIVLEP
jgi:hypothetical protein